MADRKASFYKHVGQAKNREERAKIMGAYQRANARRARGKKYRILQTVQYIQKLGRRLKQGDIQRIAEHIGVGDRAVHNYLNEIDEMNICPQCGRPYTPAMLKPDETLERVIKQLGLDKESDEDGE